MVAQLTSLLSKEVVTLLEGIHQVGELTDLHVATHLTQFLYIGSKLGLLDVHGLVRTPGRNHDGIVGSLVVGILDMVVQIVNRIIGGTYALHVVVLHQSTS